KVFAFSVLNMFWLAGYSVCPFTASRSVGSLKLPTKLWPFIVHRKFPDALKPPPMLIVNVFWGSSALMGKRGTRDSRGSSWHEVVSGSGHCTLVGFSPSSLREGRL